MKSAGIPPPFSLSKIVLDSGSMIADSGLRVIGGRHWATETKEEK